MELQGVLGKSFSYILHVYSAELFSPDILAIFDNIPAAGITCQYNLCVRHLSYPPNLFLFVRAEHNQNSVFFIFNEKSFNYDPRIIIRKDPRLFPDFKRFFGFPI